ncbi:MAG TPA: hypothetical protein PKA90_14415 [Ignavibacteria bacterium]|nr:hypothetical protein [Ignavibacteria bacterium]HMR41613.1 hypothetical protein [Ignavibacteria bacterium]
MNTDNTDPGQSGEDPEGDAFQNRIFNGLSSGAGNRESKSFWTKHILISWK